MSGPWAEPPASVVDHDVEFVVVGGLAVAAHGYPRATKDLDIVPS